MNRILALTFTLCVLFVSAANADIAYSTYGDPSHEPFFSYNVGLGVASASYRGAASKFTSAQSGSISEIRVSIGAFTFFEESTPPDRTVEVAIYEDGGNVPGASIWTTTFDPQLYYGTNIVYPGFDNEYRHGAGIRPAVETISVTGAPELTAGTDYWFGIQGLSGETYTWFSSDQTHDPNTLALRSENSEWFTFSGTHAPALFQINVVPEPGIGTLAGFVLGSVLLRRRRRV